MSQQVRDLIKKVRKIDLRTRGLSAMAFSGSYKTHFKGRGMSFSELRSYQYGDDIRNIDWNVTARTGTPYIKVFEEEREQNFMLLVDVSASTNFGSHDVNKREFMAELGATLALAAIRNNDKVGVIFFSDKIEQYLPPKKGRNHGLRIIRELLQCQSESPHTDIDQALRYLTGLIRKRCTAFLLSDFLDPNYGRYLKVAASRHDLVGLQVYDPREVELPNLGLLPIRDAETGSWRWIDSASASVRQAYKARFEQQTASFKEQFGKLGLDSLSLCSDQPFVGALRQFFQERPAL
ncbi:DUF58 domain-containing protein [Saprospira grandis]|uniref:DUF58 domain-containing protein n=1 Tax=Saprospira grandis (strain Lewin) TaxID=984262 RepID=H6L4N5_SAPGL|nr:DUF58 domain-containing protein [Saprospira grandis]AFC23959.1 hypothetical protein SGRA_1224 [Saprospira grandis str. Lewin]